MIFVAQPYYTVSEHTIRQRVKMGSLYCGALLNQGVMCVSPVVYGTTILEHVSLPKDFSFWDQISFTLLEKCSEMHVLALDGWKDSRGVTAEINRATELGIPIKYLTVDETWGEIYKSKIENKPN